MLTVDVQFDFAKVVNALNDMEQKQLPFATARALNDTAFQARSLTQRNLRSRFTLRNNFVEKGVLVRKATKTQLWAEVYDRDWFMAIHEKGGSKVVTRGGTHLAVPAAIRQTSRGLVPRSKRPEALRGNKRTFRATINGRDGLFQRKTKKRLPLTMLFAFKPSVPIRPRLGLEKDAREVVARNWSKNFVDAFGYAMRTAR